MTGHTSGRCIDGQRYAHARKTTSQRESQKSPILAADFHNLRKEDAQYSYHDITWD